MDTITNSLIVTSRKVIKFLRRDFLELEMLQRSSKGNYDFCNKSYTKIQELLGSDLQKYSKYIFFPGDKLSPGALPDLDTDEMVLLINPIDSLRNLERSIPFFALSITCLKKINQVFTAHYSVINFPALDQVYYVEKGKGVKAENSNMNVGRLRVSSCANIHNSIMVIDNMSLDLRLFQDIRIFGSHCYGILMLISGKVEAVYFSSLDYTLKACFELLVQEAGGAIIASDKAFIATNYDLAKELKDKL